MALTKRKKLPMTTCLTPVRLGSKMSIIQNCELLLYETFNSANVQFTYKPMKYKVYGYADKGGTRANLASEYYVEIRTTKGRQ
jgi:hypothetical protein